MTKSKALETLFGMIEANRALHMAGSLFHWDATTSGVPEKSLAVRGEAVGWLGGESFRRFIAPETLEAIETLEAAGSELSPFESAMIREMGLQYRKVRAVPPDEFQAYVSLVAQAEPIWETARAKRDFGMILPYYEKIFEFQKKLCDWYGYEKHPYDALLDDYEKGASVEMLDGFFASLRGKIVPLLKDIIENGAKPREISGTFDKDKQRTLLPWLTDFIGFDRTRGKAGEVEHPYCMSLSRNDVRITTKYHEDNILAAMYSTLHESGHAVYEQNITGELERYALADCASMGMHESQSRLFENIICRSRAFAAVLLPQLRKTFDYFSDWDEDSLYRAVNITRPSFIRIDADELTYSLHIMVRYELEKGIIKGEIKPAELPGLWNEKFKELLGIQPDNPADGVLQDVHWSSGLVGYFPSYAVGTAYGAQLVHAMNKSVDIETAVMKCDLSPVTGWLKENVHKHGLVLLPEDLLKQATGEPFNPEYYVDYLTGKFSEIYL